MRVMCDVCASVLQCHFVLFFLNIFFAISKLLMSYIFNKFSLKKCGVVCLRAASYISDNKFVKFLKEIECICVGQPLRDIIKQRSI